MSFNLYSKIKSHLLSIFNKRKKTGLSLLINGVPDAIKNDLLFKIYSKVINEFSIFKNVKNSNFVVQVLTSFIPIISKKEEIIMIEGEILQNIVFVKDGRLSIEIGIDLNDPHKSIEKYLEVNFTGITSHDDLNNNFLNKDISVMNMPERNFNDLKAEIDNVLLDNKKTLVNNSRIDDNGISVDLGRLDFSRNDKDNYNNDNYQIIKIIDLRKNEHFGDVHLILEKPCPFTLKAKSRIAELFLLRKYDAIVLSKNFPNIWRRMQNKSYHNLVSIKKLTFKILKRYYNTHFYNKNIRETIAFNLDATKNSGKSFYDNAPSFIKNLKTINRSINNISNRSSIMEKRKIKQSKTKNNVNKNKLFIGYEKKRKTSEETFTNELNFSSDSLDSNSFNNSSYIQGSNYFINKNKKDFIPIINIKEEENFDNKHTNLSNNLKNSNLIKEINKINTFKLVSKKKTMGNFTFNDDNEGNNFLSPKKLRSINRTKSKCSGFKSTREFKNTIYYDDILKNTCNSKKLSDKSLNRKSSKKETIKYFERIEGLKNDDNCFNFITLDNVSKHFSKKIKKTMKKRKKIQKLKELLRLQRLKINKNVIDSFVQQTIKNEKNINEIIENSNLNNSISSSNNKIVSKLMETTTSEEASTLNQSNPKFDLKSLKIVSAEEFDIQSCYKNINSLTKGKMIKSLKYKKNLERIIKKIINKNKTSSKLCFFSISPKNKKEKNNEITIKKESIDLFSEGDLTPISKTKYEHLILDDVNKLSDKNINIKTEKTVNNCFSSVLNKNITKNNSSIYFEKNIENFDDIKHGIFKKRDKNDYTENSINFEGKYLNKNKKDKKNKKENNIINNNLNNNDNNKSIKSSLNTFKELDKNCNENKLSILNNKNSITSVKIIQNNNFEDEKTKKCILF